MTFLNKLACVLFYLALNGDQKGPKARKLYQKHNYISENAVTSAALHHR